MSPLFIGLLVMSWVGEPSRSYPFAPTCCIMIGVFWLIEDYHRSFREGRVRSQALGNPDGSMASPCTSSQICRLLLAVNGPLGELAVAILMEVSLLGPPRRWPVTMFILSSWDITYTTHSTSHSG